jgi:hypothetical protein
MSTLLRRGSSASDAVENRPVRDRPTASGPGAATRRPWYIGSGVVLALFTALLGSLALGSQGKQRSLVAATQNIAAGVTLTRDMLRAERIPADAQLVGIPSNQLGSLVGKVTKVPISANSLVLADAFAGSQQPPTGFSLLAMVLEPGDGPSELRFGDRVHVLSTPLDRSGDIASGIVAVGSVWSISGGGPAGQSAGGTGRRLLNLMVRSSEETAVAQGAARRQIRLALVEGGPIWVEEPEAADPGIVSASGPANPVDSVPAQGN